VEIGGHDLLTIYSLCDFITVIEDLSLMCFVFFDHALSEHLFVRMLYISWIRGTCMSGKDEQAKRSEAVEDYKKKGENAHALISNYLCSLTNVLKIKGPIIKKDERSENVIYRTSNFTVNGAGVCWLELSTMTDTRDTGWDQNTTLTLKASENDLVVSGVGLAISTIFLQFDLARKVLTGDEDTVAKTTARIGSMVEEMLPLAVHVAKQKGYSHVLNFFFASGVLNKRMEYSVSVISKSTAVGRLGRIVDSAKSSVSAAVSAVSSVVSSKPIDARVGIDREVIIKVVERGFNLFAGSVKSEVQNVTELTAKLDSFYQSGKLNSCFPSRTEQAVDRILRIYDDC